VSVLSGVSQPSASVALQLSKPARHELIRHALDPQVAVAPPRVHARPHAPQSLSVSSGVSQPSPSVLLQSSQPPTQLPMRQLPVPHVGAAWARVQPMAHAPQSVSVVSGVSQPSPSTRLQSA